MAISKVILNGITQMDVTQKTVDASNLLSGYTALKNDGTDVVGTAEAGGNDFIITLTKNTSTGVWEPDCTYAEAQAAYDGGKNVAFEASLSGSQIPCGEDSRTSSKIKYFVLEPVVTSNDFVFNYIDYIWDSIGINANNPYPYYDTGSATAVPADVASGKVFYNADGKQTGTASGGGDIKGLIDGSVAALTLPAGLKEIRSYAFYGCESLDIDEIPSGVYRIGEYAFGNCTSLSLTSLPEGLQSYHEEEDVYGEVGQGAFSGCTSLALTALPSDWTSVPDSCFNSCKNLALTSLSNSITNIGNYAFRGCTNLALTALPYDPEGGWYQIGDYAFSGCTSLALTELPAYLTSIPEGVFDGCTSLALTALPDDVGYISDFAFSRCTSLALTALPDSLIEIGANAFAGCTSLALTALPADVYRIGERTFNNCTSLALTALPDGLIDIGDYAFYRCTGITLSALPNNMIRIKKGVFYGCTGITLASLPQRLTSIGSSAFYGCTGITISVIPTRVTEIGSNAFRECTGITSLDIPAGVSELSGTFIDCYALTTVILRKTDAPVSIDSITFNKTPFQKYGGLTGTAYVPSALIEQYKAASYWKNMYNNGGCAFLPIEGSQYEQ